MGRGGRGRFLHIKINTFLVQEQFAQASKREREREALNVGVCSPLQLQAQCRDTEEGEKRGGGGGRKANNLIKTSIKNCKNTTTQAAVKMFMQN